ncbi:EscI/YscI/HrpB family type III secretion system inner rod protein [Pseudomonas sp.]|uniref:EscI/YscI/HrpB family type III secretion system inner rod protein n=1 Tax=Pseudomonas sp. TaxID=306 RepID=UPI0026131647|nr:EscI/YscI/HrpB family type III secretion system inner rod protein [Pseudomonas sp.]
MNINGMPSSSQQSQFNSNQPSVPPDTADINWFSASLNNPTPTNHLPRDPTIAQPLNQRSALLQDLSNTAARALQKVSRSTNPVDMIKSTRAMSAFHLETVLSAKMISRTSQAIEKLTNLS